MNIQEAKTEIANSLRVYLRKDDAGRYVFPTVRQRPILLMGPPGIGKTAIMEQIAEEQNVLLVAYTMTHHTRQSAIGLPKIAKSSFDGREFSVTEYTMSEIIAEVYAAMQRTGKREGILFLDEINCVSETLAPTMLQFLQNKTFGNHALPEGWVIVAAGNPAEYNKSVREFDIVTLDRIRQIDVEADVGVFLRYAADRGLHGAVMSYLTIKPDRFYHIRRTEDSLSFVTARGWEDLSRLLVGYEALGIPVTEELVGEYLRHGDTARDFYGYYCLYRKYGTDYGIPSILAGDNGEYEGKCAMARRGDFAEKFTVVNLVLEQLKLGCRQYSHADAVAVGLHEALTGFFARQESLEDYANARRMAFETKREFGLMPYGQQKTEEEILDILQKMSVESRKNHLYDGEEVRNFLRSEFAQILKNRDALIGETKARLERGFAFITDCFGDGQELTLLVSGLTDSASVMDFIARHGCQSYAACSSRLLCSVNERELQEKCREILEKKD